MSKGKTTTGSEFPAWVEGNEIDVTGDDRDSSEDVNPPSSTGSHPDCDSVGCVGSLSYRLGSGDATVSISKIKYLLCVFSLSPHADFSSSQTPN